MQKFSKNEKWGIRTTLILAVMYTTIVICLFSGDLWGETIKPTFTYPYNNADSGSFVVRLVLTGDSIAGGALTELVEGNARTIWQGTVTLPDTVTGPIQVFGYLVVGTDTISGTPYFLDLTPKFNYFYLDTTSMLLMFKPGSKTFAERAFGADTLFFIYDEDTLVAGHDTIITRTYYHPGQVSASQPDSTKVR